MNYKSFKVDLKIKIISGIGITVGLLLISKLYYGSFCAVIFLSPISIWAYKIIKKKIYNKQLRVMEIQFKDMLVAISDLMQTGYSVENAFIESYKEIEQVYGHKSRICQEMRMIISRLKLNVNIEKIILDFSSRYEIDSVQTFYQTFKIAKRTGGNMREIIKNVCDTIVLKEKIKEEINISMNAKRLEQKVMMAIPVFLMLYISMASPGFLDIMYKTILGRIIMTICLLGYIFAYIWGEKIVSVDV